MLLPFTYPSLFSVLPAPWQTFHGFRSDTLTGSAARSGCSSSSLSNAPSSPRRAASKSLSHVVQRMPRVVLAFGPAPSIV